MNAKDAFETGTGGGAEQLFRAAWDNDLPRLYQLLDEGVAIDSIGSSGFPALYAAIENTSYAAFNLLIERGADVQSYGDAERSTPLAHAVEVVVLCETDNVKSEVEPLLMVVLALVQHGADPQRCAKPLDYSPLEYARVLERQTVTRDVALKLGNVLVSRGPHRGPSQER